MGYSPVMTITRSSCSIRLAVAANVHGRRTALKLLIIDEYRWTPYQPSQSGQQLRDRDQPISDWTISTH
jgi:hypothetical protein